MKHTLEEQIEFARWLEPKLIEVNLHCAIGGSCVFNGESEHDMDVLIYPHNEAVVCTKEMMMARFEQVLPSAMNINRVDRAEYPNARCIYRLYECGRQVDFFLFN